MKKFLLATIVLCALLVFAAQSHALLLNPGDNCDFGNETSQSAINIEIAGTIGAAEYLYKDNVSGAEDGPLAGSYQTTYLDTPSDPSGAKIEYTGGDIVGDPAFLLVKDGDHKPGWYLFCLTADFSWNGTDILELSGFWPDGGAISHVTLYGGRQVPEPATMLLLGSGLIGLGVLGRKKLFKKS